MQILVILESCLVNGEHTPAGTRLNNVDPVIAADLIANGRAVAAEQTVEHRDPEPQHRDPKPGKKAKAAPASE